MSQNAHNYLAAQWELFLYVAPIVIVLIVVFGALAWVYQRFYDK